MSLLFDITDDEYFEVQVLTDSIIVTTFALSMATIEILLLYVR